MQIIDTHCDALLKLQLSKRANYSTQDSHELLSFTNAEKIETNFNRLQAGGVKVSSDGKTSIR